MSYNDQFTSNSTADFDINNSNIQHEEEDENGAESDYSLDYEYLGPRKANYRNEEDADSDASELSSTSSVDGFDMWDEDPYSTNDFTWESNDMRLTGFMKTRQRHLHAINASAPWKPSFYRKEKGWPKQLPASSSTTNHDQSASTLSLVLSDFGSSEKLHAVYRDRIIECGKYDNNLTTTKKPRTPKNNNTTWLDHDEQDQPSTTPANSSNKFIETHASISHSNIQQQHESTYKPNNNSPTTVNNNYLSKFIPYTKYIRRSQFPVILPQGVYLALGFEPMCLAEKYGYMAIGGIEGEFELYCCMDHDKPIKLWGTKFKGKNNVLLMTNAVQIVRWKKLNTTAEEYSYYLIASMNDAGILIYDLPSHRQCQASVTTSRNLQCHIRTFDRVPINDAKVSPDGRHLVCVGDEACIFHLTVSFNRQGRIVFGTPKKLTIPPSILITEQQQEQMKSKFTFSSQYVAWSKSSAYFAHTSDTDNHVFVWRTKPHFELLYRIDAGGYTYAIQFHPELEGVLAFSNRYGYLHTVNLEECISKQDPHHIIRLLDYDRQTPQSAGHTCTPTCLPGDKKAIFHTAHLYARHEITMVSFRGEKNRRLRILAKINGLQWSRDGCYLYVSTKKRVLAYEFMQSSCRIQSLEKLASLAALSILDQENQDRKKLKRRREDEENRPTRRKQKTWNKKWNNVPVHVRHNVLADIHLASHW